MTFCVHRARALRRANRRAAWSVAATMPGRGKGRAGNQPVITAAIRHAARTSRNPRVVQDSSDSDDDDDYLDEEVVATPPAKRGRGRPRKATQGLSPAMASCRSTDVTSVPRYHG